MRHISLLAIIAFTPVLCLANPSDPKTTDATGQKFAERTPAKPLRALLAGARTSHDFPRFFLGTDAVTLKAAGNIDVANEAHAVTAEFPASFKITDENDRRLIPDQSKVHICAENAPDGRPEANPSVWVVKDPKTRIVCITLGHDALAHDNPAYKKLLVNAVNWVAAR